MWTGKRADAWDRASLIAAMLSDGKTPDFFHPFKRAETAGDGRTEIPYDHETAKQVFSAYNRR